MDNLFYLSPVDGRKSFYNKAAVVRTGEELTLLSYGTPVLHFDGKRTFTRLWSGYSVTTMRHINAFMSYCGFRHYGGKAWWNTMETDSPIDLLY